MYTQDKLNNNVAEKLRMFRKSIGLTQEAMAEKLNVSVSTYKAYELRRGIPKADVLVRLSSMANKPINYFMCEQNGEVEQCWSDIMNCSDINKLELMVRLIHYFGYDKFKNEIDKLNDN
ncbi:MAG: helix-turn-helix transcriptional regulator [Lachnospiraceae bacterium]|nr:helix-turn-helix transcriptional regulator [Lachnospiraceae bacterium]